MKPALLLIDLQNDYLAAKDLQPAADIMISSAGKLLENCRARKIPVIHVWTTIHRVPDRRMFHWKKENRWDCLAGTAGHSTPAFLQPHPGERIIHKTGFNPFANLNLVDALEKLDCDLIVLAGLHLHACVRTAAAESLERGWQVFIAEDAVASNDPVYAAATRRWLAARHVEFDSTDAILARLVGQKKREIVHRSPWQTNKILFKVSNTGSQKIAAATRAGQSAWKKWRRTKFSNRQRLLEDFARRLEQAAPALADKMAVEIGKPVSHGFEEVCRAVANVRDVIRRAEKFQFQKIEAAGRVRREPVGVVALISPWNNPVAIPTGKIAPALMYGNVVIWKPAPAATKIAEVVLKIWRKCGADRDTVQLLPGNHNTAQKLAADERVSAVTLTAGVAAGYAIQEICARRQTPLQGELSGNNAAIVWEYADLTRAAAQIVQGAFGFAGQRCTANRRVIVPQRIAEIFLRLLKSEAKKMNWGDPRLKTTHIGPVINTRKRDEHQALLLAAQKTGARVEYLFPERIREAWIQAGAQAQPAIVICDKPDLLVVQEETMSPLLVMQCAENFEQALSLCNGVRHGLVAALFSDSVARKKKFLAHAEAGMLKINSSTAGADVTLPFGGWKGSGIGPPEHGESDPLFYTRLQAIYE
jgi:acyl-CoA reductase-like NAD-dependent aldehyde dehydrogenase